MMRAYIALTRIFTVAVLMALAGSAAAQPAYPTKPIRLVVPFPPGGGTSVVARLISQKLTESWGQQVIVDNRPGGNTIIGNDAVAKAPPDGYTILFATSTIAILPSLLPYLPYDTIKDFDAVAPISKSRYVLVLNLSVRANTLQEFIALAKAKPGQLNYASGGVGTGGHLATEMFGVMTGVKMQHIPYKGGGQLLPDIVGGQVQLSFLVSTTVIPHIKSGKLKAIAISGETRSSALPQVPTFSEGGLPGFEVNIWFGIVAPAGTPMAIINKMSREMAKIVAVPDTIEILAGQGAEPFTSAPEQFAALIRADTAMYGKVIKTANIKLEN